MRYVDKGKILFCLFCIPVSVIYGQTPLLENKQAIESIKKTLELIYNFDFEEAHERIDNNDNGLGDHPANHIARAMILYWKDRPLAPGSDPYLSYEKHLNTAIELSEPFIENEKLHVEGIFYSMCGYALLAELYSEEGTGLKVLNHARKAYHYLKMGKDEVGNFTDFNFSTGLYNYYREKYPELYPFYKSFMWLFPHGDMEEGIRQLKTVRETGIFSKIEASIYLYHIFLRYENSPDKAYEYIEYLVNKFPCNTRFRSLYTEVLVARGELEKAEEITDALIQNEKPFHKLAGTLFKAIILEKRGLLSEANEYLEQAVVIEEKLDKEYFHYISMIYATKARIADQQGLTEEARDYYKKALKNEPYVPVREESLAYLDR